MAGDWFSIDLTLPDKPEVWQIAAVLEMDADAVVGRLIRVWAWANQQCADGNAPSVTEKTLDRSAGVPGFARAMEEVGWLTIKSGVMSFPNWDRWNSQNAKRRLLSNRRKQGYRERSGRSKSVPKEEKRREEKKKTPLPPFPEELDTDPFRVAWDRWLTYRRRKRKTVSEDGAAETLKQLAKMGEAAAIESIEQSIRNDYQGLFEPKDSRDGSKRDKDIWTADYTGEGLGGN